MQATVMTSTKAEGAYRALRRAIVTLAIEGGEPLDEVALSERFGIGGIPMREALKRLALEQSSVAAPHRTPYVRWFSLTDCQPFFKTRLLREVPVAGVATERATEADLTALDSNLADMERAVARDDVYDTIEIDCVFHSLVARTTQNRFLAEAINRLNRGSLRLWYLAYLTLGLKKVPSHHAEVIAAFRSGQRPLVEEVMRQHVLLSQSRVIRTFATAVDVAPLLGATTRKGADR